MKILKKKIIDCKEVLIEEELNVGDGVTLCYWSDEQPATIIEIGPSGKWLKVQEDKAVRIDNNGCYSECQEYEYSRNPNGRIHTFYKTRRKGSTFYTNTGRSTHNDYGIYLILKFRRKYFDYSF